MEKSSKQKCLDMWRWLRDNPDAVSKNEYKKYLISQGREDEYNQCWACCEAGLYSGNYVDNCCKDCPIDFPGGHCASTGSPYFVWDLFATPKERQQAAADMVRLIDETWEEYTCESCKEVESCKHTSDTNKYIISQLKPEECPLER